MNQKFLIKDTQLAEALKISNIKLAEIQNHFDAIPDDEWELIEGTDYMVDVAATNSRVYSEQGAYAIAEYLHTTAKVSFFARLKEWLTHFKQRLRQSLVKRKIINIIDTPGKLLKIKTLISSVKRILFQF